MELNVNGHRGVGVLVVPKMGMYNFKAKSKGKLHFFAVESCHRYDGREKAWGSGWFPDKSEVKFSLVPRNGIEDIDLCPYRLSAFDLNGQHSWGMVVPEISASKLHGLIYCNGKSYTGNGVSICHAKKGLLQSVRFTPKTTVKSTCSEEPVLKGLAWEYSMSNEECLHIFKSEAGEFHTHVVLPFEQVLLREDP